MTVGDRVVASGLEDLQRGLMTLDRVVVAFSGGADSALLARVAHDTLGADRVRAVTAVSKPSGKPASASNSRALAISSGCFSPLSSRNPGIWAASSEV